MIPPHEMMAEIRRAVAVTPPADRFIEAVAAHPEAREVADIGRITCAHRRTITRHLQLAGLPSPHRWMRMLRLLHAAALLSDDAPHRVTVLRAGHAVGMGQYDLSNLMQRDLGIRPTDARAVTWRALLRTWLARERAAGRLTAPAHDSRGAQMRALRDIEAGLTVLAATGFVARTWGAPDLIADGVRRVRRSMRQRVAA